MTRTSIEFAAKVYIVALIFVFIWTVMKVLQQIGWA
jgi:flagellar biogenesis protein FliO